MRKRQYRVQIQCHFWVHFYFSDLTRCRKWDHFSFMIVEELSRAKLKPRYIGFASKKKFARIWREASLRVSSLATHIKTTVMNEKWTILGERLKFFRLLLWTRSKKDVSKIKSFTSFVKYYFYQINKTCVFWSRSWISRSESSFPSVPSFESLLAGRISSKVTIWSCRQKLFEFDGVSWYCSPSSKILN